MEVIGKTVKTFCDLTLSVSFENTTTRLHSRITVLAPEGRANQRARWFQNMHWNKKCKAPGAGNVLRDFSFVLACGSMLHAVLQDDGVA